LNTPNGIERVFANPNDGCTTFVSLLLRSGVILRKYEVMYGPIGVQR